MILQGNQRGGAGDLAAHLLKSENEQVEVHELRGFVASDLHGAFMESYAVSRGTRAKQFLFSLSLNPPPSENVPVSTFEDAIARVEKKLGLDDQPRAIVFHEKEGRRHAHCVWSRIDARAIKAIPLSHSKRKLMDIARELYLEQGWKMPRGMMDSRERDLNNFTLAQWQQAKRAGKDPRAVKRAFRECWAVSDTQAAFAHALRERGYVLARGDRRGFVALDFKCEVYAVSKWAGKKAGEIRTKLTDAQSLPSVDEAREQIAKTVARRLQALQERQNAVIRKRRQALEDKCRAMAKAQARAGKTLEDSQHARRIEETRARQDRFHTGLRGLWDRLTGERRRIRERNERETQAARLRDRQEKDDLIFGQLDRRRALQARIERLKPFEQERRRALDRDIGQYARIRERKQDVADFRERMQARHSRDGPDLER